MPSRPDDLGVNRLMSLTLAGLDELDKFPSEESRREALDRWAREGEGFSSPRWWLAVALVAGGSFFAMQLTSRFMGALFPRHASVIELLAWTVGVVTFLAVLRWLHRVGAARVLRRELLRAGVPVCQGCGATLTGLPDEAGHCPECGRELGDDVLVVLGREPGVGA